MKKLLCIVPLALVFCFTIACQDKAAMAELEKFKAQARVEEQNKALFRRVIEEWNKANYEYLKEAMAPDYVAYSPSANPRSWSKEETLVAINGMREGFPDGIWSIEELVGVGDLVISRNIFRGTHKGNFGGVSATGNRIEASFILMSRITNGKIVEEKEEFDMLGLMQQLGMELKPIAAKKK
jgi:ketosteroid isomerase-like protein